MKKGLPYLLSCCLALSGSVYASPAPNSGTEPVNSVVRGNHFALIAAVGAANLKASNSYLGVTNSETDKLVQTNTNNWNKFALQLGAGYVYYLKIAPLNPDKLEWFPAIEPQLNLYYLNNNSAIQGNVLRFSSPAFNQLTYKIPVRNTRLMLDAALTILSKKQFSLYAKAGMGPAWTRIGYNDSYNNTSGMPPSSQRLKMNTLTCSSFAWELGAGMIYAFNDKVGLSLEYLYTNLGVVKFSDTGYIGTIIAPIIVPTSFNLRSQSGLLGLHYAL